MPDVRPGCSRRPRVVRPKSFDCVYVSHLLEHTVHDSYIYPPARAMPCVFCTFRMVEHPHTARQSASLGHLPRHKNVAGFSTPQALPSCRNRRLGSYYLPHRVHVFFCGMDTRARWAVREINAFSTWRGLPCSVYCVSCGHSWMLYVGGCLLYFCVPSCVERLSLSRAPHTHLARNSVIRGGLEKYCP